MTAASQTLDSFDIHAPGARQGAECLWQQMREMPGLYHNDRYGGFHVAARYADVMTVLMNPQVYGSSAGITLPPPGAQLPHPRRSRSAGAHRISRADDEVHHA